MFFQARLPANDFRHLLRIVAVAISLCITGITWANTKPALILPNTLSVWLEQGRSATLEQASPAQYQERSLRSVFGLNSANTLWVKLLIARSTDDTSQWILNIPLPFIDSVTLYQRDVSGTWQAQTAGDTVSHNQWSQKGLHPTFELNLPDSNTHTVYLQIRNYTKTSIPMRISTDAAHENQRTQEFLVLGGAIGLLLALSGISFFRYLEYRYPSDWAATIYALVVTVTVAQINGVLNATLLASWPDVANQASKIMPTVAMGVSLIYMRQLYALAVHYYRFNRFMGAVGWIAVVSSGIVLPLAPDNLRNMESGLFALVSLVALSAAFLSWRAGSGIWRWLVLATLPQGLGILWYSAEYAGLLAPVWERRYLISAGIMFSVPVLAFALSQITRDRKDRVQRAKLLNTQDALTGLLNQEAFEKLLATALERVRVERETVALALVRLKNLPKIADSYGSAVGEQCELRAVVKLHRVLRDVDPACRLAPGTFAVLLEGLRTREQLKKRMTGLLASGLIPQPGIEPFIPLEFHAACVLLHEEPLAPSIAIGQLSALLAEMRTGTRRPIRFIEAAKTQPVMLQA